jgi:hypothetical protein
MVSDGPHILIVGSGTAGAGLLRDHVGAGGLNVA